MSESIKKREQELKISYTVLKIKYAKKIAKNPDLMQEIADADNILLRSVEQRLRRGQLNLFKSHKVIEVLEKYFGVDANELLTEAN